MGEELEFRELLKDKKIPILVLDQKWHRLFDAEGKPKRVKVLEKQLNQLLARQGRLTQETKELKRLKSTLMGNIMINMEGTGENVSALFKKKLDEDKRLIGEINQRLEKYEEELADIPIKLDEYNKELMILSMEYCYDTLRSNSEEINEISQWIKQVRIDLKKNILIKQNREINSRAIYSYLHDIFGPGVVDMFDLKNSDIQLSIPDKRDVDEYTEITKDIR